jgi:hypothetical protein
MDTELMLYFPDEDMCSKTLDRKFVWDVLNTLKPEFVKTVVQNAKEKRIEKKVFRTK